MEHKRDIKELHKNDISKTTFDWDTFDLDKFFEDTKRVGEIIRKRDMSKNEE